MEVIKQPQYMPLSVAEQISILYAANEGFLDDVDNINIKKFKTGWFNYFDANMKELAEKLNSGDKLSDEDKASLSEKLTVYKTNFFK